jgi:serine protease Do
MRGKKLLSLLSLAAVGCTPALANSPVQPANTLEKKVADVSVKPLSYYDNNNRREKDKYLEAIIKSTEKVYHKVVYEVHYVFENGTSLKFDYPWGVSGSGVVFKKKGGYSYILTNNHVIKRYGLSVNVRMPKNVVIAMVSRKSEKFYVKKGGKEVLLEVLAKNSYLDAALLRAKGPGFKKFRGKIGNSDKLRRGDFVYAIGNPLGEEGYLTSGIVSKVNPRGRSDWFMMQTPVNPGNSGGPIVALHGGKYHLVGLTVATKLLGWGVPAEGMKYGVKINPIKKMVGEYFKKNKY